MFVPKVNKFTFISNQGIFLKIWHGYGNYFFVKSFYIFVCVSQDEIVF